MSTISFYDHWHRTLDVGYGISVASWMDYEWDDAKAAANLAKHGVDFVDAIGALADPNRIEDVDHSVAYGEERARIIGMTRGNILFVVITMRDEELCRIISARRATRHEQDRYYTAPH